MTTQPNIIGITGLAGAGKDTVRQILEENHAYQGMAFADGIRAMLGELLHMVGADQAYMHRRDLKESRIPQLDASYRQLAQMLGTEFGRAISDDFWVRVTAERMRLGRRKSARWVISDVRFPNEVDFIRKQGGAIWRIERPGIEPVRAHISEHHANTLPADHVIHNTGTLDDLWNAVDNLMNQTKQQP